MDKTGETGPAILVTGASAGLGRSLAQRAARRGRPIVLVARSAEGLAETETAIRDAGGRSLSLPLDLTVAHAGEAIAGFLAAQGLHCEILVNNAGFGLLGPAAQADRTRQLALVDLNIRTLVDLTLRFLPGMVARDRGGVMMVGSIAGFAPGPGMTAYYASKAFVASYAQALWQETRGTGVRVTCLAPGPVRTGFFSAGGAGKARLFKILPKLTPEEVADAAWRGFDDGRRLVVPGMSAKLTVLGMRLMPRRALLPLVARLQRDGSATES